MKSKVCTKCGVEKPVDGFHVESRRKDGRKNQCKKCVAALNKEHYNRNREQNLERSLEYYQRNRKQAIEYQQRYRQHNKEKKAKYNRDYFQQNKKQIAEYRRGYRKKRYSEDPVFKIKLNVRNLVCGSFITKGYTKKSRTYEILGCCYKDFVKHINNNPYGFTIGDERLDLDHIIPLATATTEEELLKLNHFTNFQLLPSEYNRNIKKDNPWDQAHFEEWLISQEVIPA